jgi:hypothetical protein
MILAVQQESSVAQCVNGTFTPDRSAIPLRSGPCQMICNSEVTLRARHVLGVPPPSPLRCQCYEGRAQYATSYDQQRDRNAAMASASK